VYHQLLLDDLIAHSLLDQAQWEQLVLWQQKQGLHLVLGVHQY
jgi:hypothetical protein